MKKSIFVAFAVVAFAVTSCKKSETTENVDNTDSMAVTADTLTVTTDSLATPSADSINTTVVPEATGTGTATTGADSAQ
ncbi:hypothetical protein CO230_00230 [Chryseobacterium sp. 6424]|uniref:hypothetical protein n=1 Tax=Chryseobacterium sp. 6424 TaxID=2039166 RepID=UPI000EFC0FC4|nr:hypothetical protein [Chryseobacterium sp. 6424]AYO56699.1 hypothetical protein CO230_00230 [Chryseobacterium sp. 6424]